MILIHELLQQNVIFPYPFWLKPTKTIALTHIPMGKRYEEKNTHKSNQVHRRLNQRVRLTVIYLLREKLGLEPNPEGLSEPQPLNLLEVIEYLQDVLSKQGNAKGLSITTKL